MKRAILSDIHGNLEALTAVLADAKQQGAEQIVCLGDLIGYGPNPRECIDLVMQFDVCILGNHDLGALFDPEGFSSGAERAIFWTRKQLEDGSSDTEAANRRLGLPGRIAAQPSRERPDVRSRLGPQPAERVHFPGRCLQHAQDREDLWGGRARLLPGTYARAWRVHPADAVSLPATKLAGNTCSATKSTWLMWAVSGNRAMATRSAAMSCWMTMWSIFAASTIRLEKTVEKIYAIAELDNFLGDRLREGR